MSALRHLDLAGHVSAGEHVCVTAPALNTKSPKNTLTFCNRVTMETRVQLHQGGMGVSRKRETRVGGREVWRCTMRSAVPKIGEAGMNCNTWTCSDVCVTPGMCELAHLKLRESAHARVSVCMCVCMRPYQKSDLGTERKCKLQL